MIEFFPEPLRQSIHSHLHQDILYRIPFLRHLKSAMRHDIMIKLYTCMQPETYPKDFKLATRHDIPNRCFVLAQGSVDVMLYDGANVSTHHVGDHFGALCLVSEDFAYLIDGGVPVEYRAMTRVVFLTLKKQVFASVIKQFDAGSNDSVQKEVTMMRLEMKRVRRCQQIYWKTFDWHDNPQRLMLLQRWWSLVERLICLLGRKMSKKHGNQKVSDLRKASADSAYDIFYIADKLKMIAQTSHRNINTVQGNPEKTLDKDTAQEREEKFQVEEVDDNSIHFVVSNIYTVESCHTEEEGADDN